MTTHQASLAIEEAIKKGDLAKTTNLLEAFPELLNVSEHFGTWLHLSAEHGRTQIIAYLLDKGLDINQRGSPFDAAPIKLAASYGRFETVRYLLSRGAELDVSEPTRNPLFGAITEGHLSLVKLLLEAGIDASVRYTGQRMKNMGALEHAQERGQTKIADIIREHLANANS